MSRFKKGDVVWTGRDQFKKKMIVDRVIDNGHIPVYQYTFLSPNDGFACGEQSIRESEDGPDLKLRDCFKYKPEKQSAEYINTIASAKRNLVDAGEFGLEDCFKNTQVRFKPSLDMCEWLTKYANGRLIIHVGSGQGHLVRMLKMAKARAIGIEPNFNKKKWIELRMSHDGRFGEFDVNEILEGTVDRYSTIIKGLRDKVLLIFTRPLNNDFVMEGLSIMSDGAEALYITKEDDEVNVTDIGRWNSELLKHEGNSEEDEIVYSIKK